MTETTTPATLFAFQNERVRVLTDANGEPLFVVADVCRVLDHTNPTMAVQCIDEADLSTAEVRSESGNGVSQSRMFNVVNESGLYALIFASRKPEAKEFKRWVTKEVLPAIRKTGAYAVSQSPALPTSYKEAVKALLAEIEAKEALALENAELKPKAEFFDAVASSDDAISMNEAAKLIGWGRNKLMAKLREDGVFRANNTPYQSYIDDGYFKVVESKWTDSKGDSHIALSTKVFQRGVDFLLKKTKAS